MEARIKTFLAQVENGNIRTKTAKILRLIKDNPRINTDELRTKSTLPHQTLTAIITNLLDMGVVRICGSTEKQESHYSHYIFVGDEAQILSNQKSRKLEKYKYWLKRGADEFADFLGENSVQALKNRIDNIERGEVSAPITVNTPIPESPPKVDEHNQVVMF